MRETGWRQKRSNKATKKGMTSTDTNNVEQSTREGLSSHNRPNDLRDRMILQRHLQKRLDSTGRTTAVGPKR